MKVVVREHKFLLLLLLAYVASELIVNPLGNFPLNDDWTYGKSALLLHNTGKVDIGSFPSMTLVAHLYWGVLFTKLFGFSFTVLRFSTLISGLIGLLFLNKLVVELTSSKLTAFLLCLTLLFNPIYFNLNNTYMTDVNFNTLLVLICYCAFVFFRSGNRLAFVLVFVFSAALILIRQYGMTAPLCFTACCLFLSRHRWLYTAVAILLTWLVIRVFNSYEAYLKTILDSNATYKFAGNFHVTQRVFWDMVWVNFKTRYATLLLHILLYTFPFIIIFGWQLVKEFKILASALLVLVFLLVYYVFKDERFPIGNIFINTAVGTETFYENLHPQFKTAHEHTYMESMNDFAALLKYFLITITTVLSLLLLIKLRQLKFNPLKKNPFLLFVAGMILGYIFLVLVTDSYFDRYHVPLFTLMLILFSYAARYYKADYQLAVLPLLFFGYISVFGTKDYLELNRTRWKAYDFIKNDLHADYKKINGGFEVNCWFEGQPTSWWEFLSLDNYDYLIQYRQEKDFRVLRTYEFQRWFPYKKDKLYIFARERKSKTSL